MSPQKNQSGEIVRSVWKQLFVKYGLCNSHQSETSSEGGPFPKSVFSFISHTIHQTISETMIFHDFFLMFLFLNKKSVTNFGKTFLSFDLSLNSRVVLQILKRIVNYYVKKLVKESQ